MRRWLQLFRAQTGFATYYTVVIPYLFAGGDFLKALALLPVLLMLHYATFGHNSVMDYWYDVKDVHKQHHPLVKGVVDLRKAHQVIHTMLIIVLIILAVLTLSISPSPAIALAFLLAYTVFGHAYNDGLDKNTIHSWIPISLCFTSLGVYGWFLGSSEFNIYLVLLAVVLFSSIFYQIAFEGNLKDICVEHTLLNVLAEEVGCVRSDRGTIIVYRGPKFSWLRIFVDTIILSVIIGLCRTGVWSWVALGLLLATSVVQTAWITSMNMRLNSILRDELLEYFGKIEAIQFFRVMTVVVRDLNTLLMYVVLFSMGVGYFILMNRVLWGSKWGPRV